MGVNYKLEPDFVIIEQYNYNILTSGFVVVVVGVVI